MGNRLDEDGKLETTVTSHSRAFTDLMNAAKADDPKERLEAVIRDYSDKPYAEDVVSKAKALYFLRKHKDSGGSLF